jgi:hypothetical protein
MSSRNSNTSTSTCGRLKHKGRYIYVVDCNHRHNTETFESKAHTYSIMSEIISRKNVTRRKDLSVS